MFLSSDRYIQLYLSLKMTMEILYREFATSEISRVCRVTQRRIIALAEMGILRASVAEAQGYQSRRLFSYQDAVFALLVTQLSSALVTDSLRRLARFVEGTRDTLNEEVQLYLSIKEGEGLRELYAVQANGQASHMKARSLEIGGFFMESTVPKLWDPSLIDRGIWLFVPMSDIHLKLKDRINKL